MPFGFNASGDYLTESGTPPNYSAFSFTAWIRRTANPPVEVGNLVSLLGSDGENDAIFWCVIGDDFLTIAANGAEWPETTLKTGMGTGWYFVGGYCDGTTEAWSGISEESSLVWDTTGTVDTDLQGASTTDEYSIGGDVGMGSALAGEICNLIAYDSLRTPAQLLEQKYLWEPLRGEDQDLLRNWLPGWHTEAGTFIDYAGKTWTEGGTVTNVAEGPPIMFDRKRALYFIPSLGAFTASFSAASAASDVPTAMGQYKGGLAASANAEDSLTKSAQLLAAISASAPAGADIDRSAQLIAAITAAASAGEGFSPVAQRLAALALAINADATYAGRGHYGVGFSASGAATDSLDKSAQILAALNESISADDIELGVGSYIRTLDSGGAAIEQILAVVHTLAAWQAGLSANDAWALSLQRVASFLAAGSSSASWQPEVAYLADLVESASAVDDWSALSAGQYAGSLTASGTAGEAFAVTIDRLSTLNESAAAADVIGGIAALLATFSAAGAAMASFSTTKDIAATLDESGAATVLFGAQALLRAQYSDDGTAAAAFAVSSQLTAAIVEAASATTVFERYGGYVASFGASGTATAMFDYRGGTGLLLASISIMTSLSGDPTIAPSARGLTGIASGLKGKPRIE